MIQAGYIKYSRICGKSTFKKAEDFARSCYETNKVVLAQRNQINKSVAIKQNTFGKIGEVLDEIWFDKVGFKLVKGTDFEIYPSCLKSFISDLIVTGDMARKFFNINKEEIWISCKTSFYEMGPSYTEYVDGIRIPVQLPRQHSWVYQLGNNSRTGGRDNGEHDVYVFNIIDPRTMNAMIYAWINKYTVEKMFIKPNKISLKNNKLVIQRKTCGGLKLFPCGIDELLDKNYEIKKSI